MNVNLPVTLKVLSDSTRLRILALLAQEELSVGELARCLAMSQSRISNHLKVLREAGMLRERREGAFVHVRLAKGNGLPANLWTAIEPRLSEVEGRVDDLERLRQVLEDRRRRSREFFDRVAQDWDCMGSDFSSGSARLRALHCLIPRNRVVADVGCGTGYIARALVHVVDKVICIDHSEAMLEQARGSLSDHEHVELRKGELDSLPLADGEVDAVFANMVMHHVPDLYAALRELRRVLKPGGRLVITDLLPHRETWMTEEMADLKLGLDPVDLKSRAERARFEQVATDPVDDLYVVVGPHGRKVELPMFLLSAGKARVADVAQAPSSKPKVSLDVP
jgi:ArsR family transcriptional regulator